MRNDRRSIVHFNVTDSPTAIWTGQNPCVERVIGSIGGECLDRVIILNDRHLRCLLREYVGYYDRSRTRLGLDKDCPVTRPVEPGAAGRSTAP